ncbi:hypothetical protein K457DRAFT_368194 [Linnemannia elongata AG-77]|uniref:Uncharacterized protein n=1 Tax=Linnemannia elongata AG-77 TaxID=1314771 RepID=A0A197K2B2_9FUNG|nr:hypothetical protein K457DRAFT_368194 [Linnemannia elongata AG-77]
MLRNCQRCRVMKESELTWDSKNKERNVLRMNMKADVLSDREGNQCGGKREKEKRREEKERDGKIRKEEKERK